MTTPSKVPVGPASIVGYGLAATGVVTAVLTAITASEAQLAGPGKWVAILGVASAVATNVGRQLQALGISVKVPAAVSATVAELPTLEEELAQQPGVGVPGASAVPDGAISALPPVPGAPAGG